MIPITPATQFQLLWHFLRVKHPKVSQVSPVLALAIAQHEAGPTFSSNLALTAHNIFGMKYPAGRAAAGLTTATGKTASGFAIFKSLYSCIDDWQYWLEVQGITNDAQLDDFIKSGKYCPDANYYKVWSNLVAQLRPTMLDMPKLVAESALGGTALAVAISALKKMLK